MMKKVLYIKPKIKIKKIRVKLYKRVENLEELLLSSSYLAANCEY